MVLTMNRCASVRKKGSRNQCVAKPLRGHTLCGRHAKMKTPVLWASLQTDTSGSAIRIQALVRGWLVRQRLSLAGPGVLCRKNLANEEDLVTLDSRVHPMEYFAFEQSGKIWWFSFDTLWKWSRRSHEPVNPYTKVPIPAEALTRLRTLWAYCRRHRWGLPEESMSYEERLEQRWNILSQTFQSHGFLDVHPNAFLRLTKADYIAMYSLLSQDLLVVLPETDPQREKILRFCQRAVASTQIIQPKAYILQSVYILMILVSYHKNAYTMVFSILSALYRC